MKIVENNPCDSQAFCYLLRVASNHGTQNKMKTFARILNTPAESRPVYNQQELEADRAGMQAAIAERSEKLQRALLTKINTAKANGLSAREIQLTESEIKLALA